MKSNRGVSSFREKMEFPNPKAARNVISFPPKLSENFWRIDCSSINLSSNHMKKNRPGSGKTTMPKTSSFFSKLPNFQGESFMKHVSPSRKKKEHLRLKRTPAPRPTLSTSHENYRRSRRTRSRRISETSSWFESNERKQKKIRRRILRNVVEKLQNVINHDEFEKMFPNLDYSIFQGLTFDESFKGSFTVDKTNVNLCLKNPVSGMIYDQNSITFVALHELAHVINPLYGHGREFQKIFKNVLKVADKIGVWDSQIPFTKQYCGTCKNGECYSEIPMKSRFMFVVKN